MLIPLFLRSIPVAWRSDFVAESKHAESKMASLKSRLRNSEVKVTEKWVISLILLLHWSCGIKIVCNIIGFYLNIIKNFYVWSVQYFSVKLNSIKVWNNWNIILSALVEASFLFFCHSYLCEWGGVVDGKPYLKDLGEFGKAVLEDLWTAVVKQFVEVSYSDDSPSFICTLLLNQT